MRCLMNAFGSISSQPIIGAIVPEDTAIIYTTPVVESVVTMVDGGFDMTNHDTVVEDKAEITTEDINALEIDSNVSGTFCNVEIPYVADSTQDYTVVVSYQRNSGTDNPRLLVRNYADTANLLSATELSAVDTEYKYKVTTTDAGFRLVFYVTWDTNESGGQDFDVAVYEGDYSATSVPTSGAFVDGNSWLLPTSYTEAHTADTSNYMDGVVPCDTASRGDYLFTSIEEQLVGVWDGAQTGDMLDAIEDEFGITTLTADEITGYNLISWQDTGGGWMKNNPAIYTREWDGSEVKLVYIDGDYFTTIDNDATVPEIDFLLDTYIASGNEDMKTAALKGIDFLFDMQYASGGLPLYYPRVNKTGLEFLDYAAFNDYAMVNVLTFYKKILDDSTTYDTSVISTQYRSDIQDAFDLGIDFIINSQITYGGTTKAWCAQHDPVTYEAKGARAFELASVSGYESVGVLNLLTSLGSSDQDIIDAIADAKAWFASVVEEDTKYDRYAASGDYFYTSTGDDMWYRFYEISTDTGFFADYASVMEYDIWDIDEERRHGYVWAGDWGDDIV